VGRFIEKIGSFLGGSKSSRVNFNTTKISQKNLLKFNLKFKKLNLKKPVKFFTDLWLQIFKFFLSKKLNFQKIIK
jgi:hypothetical protein